MNESGNQKREQTPIPAYTLPGGVSWIELLQKIETTLCFSSDTAAKPSKTTPKSVPKYEQKSNDSVSMSANMAVKFFVRFKLYFPKVKEASAKLKHFF